jgi:hypothetical protein
MGEVPGAFLRSGVGPQGPPNLFELQLPDHRVEVLEIESAGMGSQDASDVLNVALGCSLPQPEELADDGILGGGNPGGHA